MKTILIGAAVVTIGCFSAAYAVETNTKTNPIFASLKGDLVESKGK
jgi:hypothetical protein